VQPGVYIISARKRYDALTLRVVYRRSGKKEEVYGVFGLDPRENEPVGPDRDQVARDIEQLPKLSTASSGCRCPNNGAMRVRSVEVVKGEYSGTAPTNSYEITFRAAVEGLSDFKLEERGSATSPSCPTHFCGEECANRPYDPRCAQRQALANLLSNFEAPDARERARAGATPPNILSGRTYVLEAKLRYIADPQRRWSIQSYQAASISPAAHRTARGKIANEPEANEQPAMPDDDATRPRFVCIGGRPGEQCDQPPELARKPMSERELGEQRAQMEAFNDLVACVTSRPGAKVDPEYLKYADAFFAIKEGKWYGLIPGAACVKLGGEMGPLMDLAAFEVRHIRDIIRSIYGISVQAVCDNSGQIESKNLARLVCGKGLE
jgi:hypothetical protein